MDSEWLHNIDQEGRTPFDRALASGHMALAELMMRQEKEDAEHQITMGSGLHNLRYYVKWNLI